MCREGEGTRRSSQCISSIDVLSSVVFSAFKHGSELHQLSNQGCLSILQADSDNDGSVGAE